MAVPWLLFPGVKLSEHERVAVMDRNKGYWMCPLT
jgi:hypothetical protein